MYQPEGLKTRNALEFFARAKEQGLIIPARVIRAVAGPNGRTHWELEFDKAPGIVGIVEAADTGLEDTSLMHKFVGQDINVKVLGFREGRIVLASRKAALDTFRGAVAKNLKQGEVVDVAVRAITPKEVIVDVGNGVTVNVPRKLATRSEVKSLYDLFVVGEQVKAKVLQTEPELQLSIVDAEPDPWMFADYHRDDVVQGTVTSVVPEKGLVFIELKPGIVGIASTPARGAVTRGQRVVCVVSNPIPERKKIHLHIKSVLM